MAKNVDIPFYMAQRLRGEYGAMALDAVKRMSRTAVGDQRDMLAKIADHLIKAPVNNGMGSFVDVTI